MEFELTPELADQIIFAMENQERDYVLDSKTCTLLSMSDIPTELIDEEDRFITLPEWFSVHGYNLMEKFVANLKNPLYREALRDILASGKGVFRHFKDTVKQRKEIERLWFSFKEKEMKRIVFEWYNQLRDTWGLSRIGFEPEETEELILSDFVMGFEKGERLDIIRELDRKAFEECYAAEEPEITEHYYQKRLGSGILEFDEGSLILVAETPVGEFAGFVWGRKTLIASRIETVEIIQLFVMKEYRGLGLAKVLLHRFCQTVKSMRISRIRIELPGSGVVMLNAVKKLGFLPVVQVLGLDLDEWLPAIET